MPRRVMGLGSSVNPLRPSLVGLRVVQVTDEVRGNPVETVRPVDQIDRIRLKSVEVVRLEHRIDPIRSNLVAYLHHTQTAAEAGLAAVGTKPGTRRRRRGRHRSSSHDCAMPWTCSGPATTAS